MNYLLRFVCFDPEQVLVSSISASFLCLIALTSITRGRLDPRYRQAYELLR